MESIVKAEEWKKFDLDGLGSEIYISSHGRVRCESYNGGLGWHGIKSRKKRKHTLLTPSDNGNGYKYFTASVNGKRKHFYVHRIVAQLFIPNPENKPHVNHINYNRGDNRVNNLEWCTPHENIQHSAQKMRRPRKYMTKYGKGIRRRECGVYEVTVCSDCKQHYVGRFKTLEDAVIARDKKVLELGITNYV